MLTSPTGGAGPPSRGRRLLSAIALTGRPLVAAGVGQRLAFAAVGIALLAGDLPLGRWAGLAGGVLIVVASVPWPWGRDRYRGRVRRAQSEAVRSIKAARDRQQDAERERLHDLGRVLAPGRLAADGDALIAAYVAAQQLREDRSVPDAGRMIELFALRLRAKELEASVAASAGTDEETRYSTAVAACAAARKRDLDDQALESLRAVSELITDLEQLRPPRRLRTRHDALCRALRDEYVASSAFNVSLDGSDLDTVRQAFDAYEHAFEARSARFKELGFFQLFPAPSRSSTISRPLPHRGG